MNKKIFFSFAIFIFVFAIFAAGVQASSVTGNLFWDSTFGKDLTISNGDSALILVSADTIFESSMTVNVDLVDSSGNTISNLLYVFTKSDSYTNSVLISKSLYKLPGTYKVKLKVTAASGQFVTDELNLVVNKLPDTTSPVVSISSPSEGATYTVNKTQLVATITEKNLAQCWYNLGSGDVSFSCIDGVNVINSISSKQGVNTWKVYAKDGAGNIGSDTVTFTVQNPADTTPPTLSISDPTNGAIYTTQRTSLTFNTYDDHLKSCSYSLDGSNFIVFSSAKNGVNIITGISSISGSNTWTVQCKDVTGNAASKSVTFTVNIPTPDTTAPIVKILTPTNGGVYTTNQTSMTATVNEDTALDSCWYNLGGQNISYVCNNGTNVVNSIMSHQGTNYWEFYAKDIFGNVGSDRISFVVKNPADTTSPVVNLIDPTDGATYPSQRTSLSFKVTDENLKSCSYSLDGTNFNSIPSPKKGLNTVTGISSISGSNTWIVECLDLAGNKGTDSVTFTVNIPGPTDTTAPVVKITNPVKGGIYTTNRTQLNSIITEENLAQCWYNLGSGNVSFSCVNGTNTINSISSKQGLNTWKVYAKDASGNVGSDTVNFTVISSPTSPLEIIPIVPTSGQIIKGSIILEAIVNKASNVTYSLDGGANVTMTEKSSLNFVSSSLSLIIGTHTVIFCAKDSAEAVCKSVTFEVIKDKSSEKKTCTSCRKSNNGPLNGTVNLNKKNLPGLPGNEEVLQLNVKSPQLNILERLFLWIKKLLGL